MIACYTYLFWVRHKYFYSLKYLLKQKFYLLAYVSNMKLSPAIDNPSSYQLKYSTHSNNVAYVIEVVVQKCIIHAIAMIDK
jgi:hypothetical protein